MSQMSMFDYISSITIGSIAAEMATSLEDDWKKPLIAMVIYALLDIILAISTSKFIKVRRLLSGRPSVLYDNGRFYYKNLKKAKMDSVEFLMKCRYNGYFDLADIQTAVLEANGMLSILPVAKSRPVTPNDLNLSPRQEQLVANVIIDGKVMEENLKNMGHDKNWLISQLRKRDIELSKVFIATCDEQNALNIYVKLEEKVEKDILE